MAASGLSCGTRVSPVEVRGLSSCGAQALVVVRKGVFLYISTLADKFSRNMVFVFLFLTSLCMTGSRSIHLTTNNSILLPFMAE